jgi:hypothetical protein
MAKIESYNLFLEDFEKTYVTKSNKTSDDPSKITKVIFALKGNDAAKVTNIVNQLEEIKALESELQKKKEKLECASREVCDALSEAEDIVITRVLKTSKVLLTISGMTSRNNVKWEKAFEEMSQKFTPSIIKQMNEIISSYTTVSDVKSRITSKVKEESFGDWVQKGKDFIKNLFNKIISWSRNYDKSLDEFINKYGIYISK